MMHSLKCVQAELKIMNQLQNRNKENVSPNNNNSIEELQQNINNNIFGEFVIQPHESLTKETDNRHFLHDPQENFSQDGITDYVPHSDDLLDLGNLQIVFGNQNCQYQVDPASTCDAIEDNYRSYLTHFSNGSERLENE
ncbi:hypothetical protein NQ314_017945 [Rhamnusium bicolor]|uniref:Uncharacterized protein n=1 Tax=Rhamnusium bicolor TaxID=1586634 RepID=A0AAV8WRK5_9CUCU|nr:hypothetical protein NQ314_017945 [Rhamnusium bicolor]